MENRKERKPHCLVLPFPIQGHINPMIQFSKRLKHKGIPRITLVTTKFFLKTAKNFPADSFPVETISDGFDDGGSENSTPEEYYKICWEIGSETLGQLVEKLRRSGSAVDCLIYDPFFPWAFDVAKKFGLTAAMFFTQSNSVNSIYLHAYKGELKLPIAAAEDEIRISGGLPPLKPADMPSFLREYETDPGRCEMMVKQFRNVEMVFVNTFQELEREVCEGMAKLLPAVRAIGPTIPSFYLDKRLAHDKEYGLSAFDPITDPCLKWLNKQPQKSVIYISFGSFAQPPPQQIEELALALKAVDMNFLWVVRSSEQSKLPDNFLQEISDEKGFIVTWCNQLEVLAHVAIGCFVTHCGWNSTLEGLSSGVPMVGVPQWSDQSTNGKFVMDVWETGIRADVDSERGIVGRREIVRCVKHVMVGETGEGIRRNAVKWKRLAREGVDEGGSSDRNIQEFVSTLLLAATC